MHRRDPLSALSLPSHSIAIHTVKAPMALTLSYHILPRAILSAPNPWSAGKLRSSISTPSTQKRLQISCRKKDLHPEFYESAKVYCNGELVMTTGGTLKEYTVDVWSGNHPFYRGDRSASLPDDDQVEKFKKKFGELANLMVIPNLKGEIVIPPKRKAGKGGKKK